VRRIKRCTFVLLAVLGLAAPAAAQKTDVIAMANGDSYTGEIKSYSVGRLLLDTDNAGNVSIKWNKIVSITSSKIFDIELADGTHVYGSLSPSTPAGKLDIVSETERRTLDFLAVVRMARIRRSFWNRIDGSFDLGFTYTQANQFVQFDLNGDATYRTKAFAVITNWSVFLSKQQGVTSSQRAAFSMDYAYFLKNRWFLGGLTGLDRNLDLGLDRRVSAGVGGGRYLVQTNQTQLAALAGILVNHETPVSGESSYNAEAFVGAQYSTFMYDFPKLTFKATLKVFPSLTETGRVRLQLNASAQREIVSDFYIAISIFDSFDSEPPTEGAAKNDWGPVISIGYKF
jgi:Protein of unknown function, DUF481